VGGLAVIIELTKEIKLIRPEALAVFPYSNSLFIDDETKTLIDAGSGRNAYSLIDCESIRLVLFTHYHFDHTNGISLFPKAKKMVGKEELWIFKNEENYNQARGYQYWQELVGTERVETFSHLWQLSEDIPAPFKYQKINIDSTFQEDEVIDLGVTTVKPIYTPGHTPGHYAFFFPKEKILYSGDYDASNRGPWYGDGPANIEQIIASVNKLIALKPRLLVGSHRKPIDQGIEQALYDWLNIALDRENRIFEFLTAPRTLEEMLSLKLFVNWGSGTEHHVFWEKMMLTKHLEHMQKLGLIVKTIDNKFMRTS
jgi:endoribonuclease LACTB2